MASIFQDKYGEGSAFTFSDKSKDLVQFQKAKVHFRAQPRNLILVKIKNQTKKRGKVILFPLSLFNK